MPPSQVVVKLSSIVIILITFSSAAQNCISQTQNKVVVVVELATVHTSRF